MIYIVTAMYAEAHPFITRFQLKKNSSHTRFQVFLDKDANLCLIISGTGAIPSATAVSSICTEYGSSQGDFLLNVGICAQIWNENKAARRTENPYRAGQIFLCSKITEQVTGRTFYPDLLYHHRFAEAPVLTGAKLYHKTAHITEYLETGAFCLYDLEAAAIYQAGSYYFGPHQMSFLKVVSDDGTPENVSPVQIGHLIGQNMDNIADYITTIQTILREPWDSKYSAARPVRMPYTERQQESFQQDPLPGELEQLCLDLHCSRTMSESLRQHIRYCILAGVDYTSVLKEMYQEGKLPCKDKREGKRCFEELKERLL